MRNEIKFEIWKPIKGYEEIYEVSSFGRVKSKHRKEKILKYGISKAGYKNVCLSINGKKTNKTIHQLVAIAFLNHIPNGLVKVVDHINEDKLDNRKENLQIITNRENLSRSGNVKKGRYTGVYKNGKKWVARTRIKGKLKYLGAYDTAKEASESYQEELKLITNKENIW